MHKMTKTSLVALPVKLPGMLLQVCCCRYVMQKILRQEMGVVLGVAHDVFFVLETIYKS